MRRNGQLINFWYYANMWEILQSHAFAIPLGMIVLEENSSLVQNWVMKEMHG